MKHINVMALTAVTLGLTALIFLLLNIETTGIKNWTPLLPGLVLFFGGTFCCLKIAYSRN